MRQGSRLCRQGRSRRQRSYQAKSSVLGSTGATSLGEAGRPGRVPPWRCLAAPRQDERLAVRPKRRRWALKAIGPGCPGPIKITVREGFLEGWLEVALPLLVRGVWLDSRGVEIHRISKLLGWN